MGLRADPGTAGGQRGRGRGRGEGTGRVSLGSRPSGPSGQPGSRAAGTRPFLLDAGAGRGGEAGRTRSPSAGLPVGRHRRELGSHRRSQKTQEMHA